MKARVLIVDDSASMAEMLADGLSDRGFDATPMESSAHAAERLRQPDVDALVTDLRMPEVDGLGLLAVSRRFAPARPVIVMTAYSALETAIESIRQGAYHYLTKPFKVDELALFLDRALDEVRVRREAIALKRTLRDRFAIANVIGESAAMQEIGELVLRVADASTPVLLTGETGTGKGLVARAIHAESGRASGRFVTINCAAMPENLLESELFGHVRGAFTSATSNRAGLFEEADGGTLFLDEVAELSLGLQAKLLDVLERSVVRPVGANKERPVNVRVIAATNRDLRARVKEGALREDLLYRLEVITLELPPLRLRRDDIPTLFDHFLAGAKAKHPRSPVERLAPDAMQRLLAHDWPGNVRELEHLVERVVVLGRAAEVPSSELPATIRHAHDPSAAPFSGEVIPMRAMSRRYAQWAYEALGGRKLATAEKLGIDAKTLAKLLAAPEAAPERDPHRDPEGD